MNNKFKEYHKIKGWDKQDFSSISNIPLVRTYSNIIRKYIPSSIHAALDFGFGNGEMLRTFRILQVRDIFGLEINDTLVTQANNIGFKAYNNIADAAIEKSGQFDLITAMHVLEHIEYEELIGLFDYFGKLLKPGGYLITSFPNGESPFANFAFNSDPTHVTLLTRETCRIITLDKPLKLIAFHKFPAIESQSQKILKRLISKIRESAETFIFLILTKIIYGNQNVLLNPVAVAVWKRY